MTLFVTQLRDALDTCITVLCWAAAVLVICVVVLTIVMWRTK